MVEKCRECKAVGVRLVEFLVSPPDPLKDKYFYLCSSCWKKDLDNEGLTYSDIAGW
jgi:hypothetical protein